MSKFHIIKLDDEYTVRDVPIPPFKKKFRVAPIKLKYKLMEKLDKNENIPHLRYINNRIHYFIENETLLYIEDNELAKYLQIHTFDIKNNLEI